MNGLIMIVDTVCRVCVCVCVFNTQLMNSCVEIYFVWGSKSTDKRSIYNALVCMEVCVLYIMMR